ncbi:nuclear transport factor 2 family protein [Acidiferrimicrobium sp. IK]|uniref:nuclear transport factor 2 family protein n=1 Tax=Acidiferrimicrobium sp. IK TaxID=2871700 RepID=UPI0021CB7EDD|nr:nuclear transport factor 2 family protein [Acidiferrimicrobium sp. IK]MCU4184191.1 nuclear transport factor 2 family protein [Acidiferrimicrobium sp. IK]
MTPQDLIEVDAICRLKYRYIRALDLKQWDEMAETLTPDAEAAFSSGRLCFSSRDEIIGFMRQTLGDADTITSHRVHHPEIDLTGPATATATWALDDVVISQSGKVTIRGAAYYRDELVKQDGEWRIRRTGYRRVYEEMESRERPGLTLTDTWWTHTHATSAQDGGITA